MSLDSPSFFHPLLGSDESSRCASSGPEPHHHPALRAMPDKKVQQLCATFKDWLPDLSQLQGIAGMIDVYWLAPSRWSCRDGDLFHPGTDDDSDTQLPGTDSRTVPLIIRPWPEGVPVPANFPQARYEVLCGSRRLMAYLRCIEAAANAPDEKAPFASMQSTEELVAEALIFVVLLTLDDQEAARVVVHSNQKHRPLRPFEFGCTCRKLLADDVFESQKELAQAMGRQESEVSRGIALSQLDPVVLGAFRSALELHYTDGPDLKQAWENDAEGLTHRALQATQHHGLLDRKAVLAILLGTDNKKSVNVPSMDIEVEIEGVLYFVISTTATGTTKVKVLRKHLCAKAIDALVKTLQAMGEKDRQDLFKPE